MRVVAARDGAVKPFAIWITGAHVHVVTLGLLYVKSRRWLPWGKRPPFVGIVRTVAARRLTAVDVLMY
jgi:hypothetical protein